MITGEPQIKLKDIIKLQDSNFNKKQVCIVTGVASGIGRATAIAASFNNLQVVGIDTDELGGKKSCEISKKLGVEIVFIKTDLTKDLEIKQAIKKASKLGQIRYLANIAGMQHIDPIEKFPMEKFDLMQKVMLRAPFLLSKLVIPHFKNSFDKRGVIGNMASIHAHISTLNKSAYNITKFGLRGLTQSIAAEGEGRIRSFSISTGFVKTPLITKQIPFQAKQRDISENQVVQDVMLGVSRVKEMMDPIEVANLFIFGFSHYSKHLNGGDLLFDGGIVKTY